MDADLSQPLEFHPELLSRRGELVAWGLALAVLLTWVVLAVSLARPPLLASLMALMLLFSAASISLGNWMDRRTVLRLDSKGVRFRNGLRDIHLSWGEIQHLRVLPSSWGDKVQVIGDGGHFAFRTLGEVSVQGQVKGRMGFADGTKILQILANMGGLHPLERSKDEVYYARE